MVTHCEMNFDHAARGTNAHLRLARPGAAAGCALYVLAANETAHARRLHVLDFYRRAAHGHAYSARAEESQDESSAHDECLLLQSTHTQACKPT